ncbi:MAG: glycosyltransferase [Eubacteriales bacterium]|nr:glycosyltransferase [Eubacteriales bacterium]
MDEILVSISCITFNHAKYIRQALDSFLSQKTNFKYEILIHDDASSDETPEIIREYQEKYPDIIFPILQKENQYSQGKRNISGIFNFPRARGKYIAMCEGDDFWCDENKLARQVAYMEEHEDCSMCCHSAKIVQMDDSFRTVNEIHTYGETRKLEPSEVIAKKTNFPTASLMFRTEYAKKLPAWYFDCPVGDIPLHLIMQMHGYVYYMDEIMSAYRTGDANSWSNNMDENREHWTRHQAAMKKLFEAFDKDTGNKYSEEIKDALMRNDFLIALKLDELKVLREKRYRKYYMELGALDRRLLLLKYYCPFLYDFLRKIRIFMKRSSL